ncbi:MAG: hypothetical protein MR770_09890 [Desulfovibrio piger]|nr:hypothetical protein [Desulfovibrio piger]
MRYIVPLLLLCCLMLNSGCGMLYGVYDDQRLSGTISDDKEISLGIESDPLRALALFQQAEIGLRLDIADGQTYYRARLEEAIEGQRRARELLDGAVGPKA